MTGAPVTRAAYVVIECSAAPCRGGPAELGAALRDCVAHSAHGVLVVAGCMLGRTGCRLRSPGAVVVVQRCDTERRPIGAGIRVGPVRTADDVIAVQEWLRAGRFDAGELPGRLTALYGAVRN